MADDKQAAERVKQAGFDGVEVHSANGYLLDTFLQLKANHRADAYGGSIENRYRLLARSGGRRHRSMGAEATAVRLAPNGVFNDMGSKNYREQFRYAAEQLNSANLAYLHVMDGLAFGFHELGEAMILKEFRKVFDGPLMGNCGDTQETAEAAIVAKDADMISIGRPLISNPDLVNRFANDLALAPESDVVDWYCPAGANGYADFPTASPIQATEQH